MLYRLIDRLLNLHRDPYMYKIMYILIMIFIFSIIYTFYDNDEFAGWTDMIDDKIILNLSDKDKEKIFKIYSNDKEHINREQFMNIPIVKIGNHFHMLHKKNMISQSKQNVYFRNLLYDVFTKTNDDKLSIKDFIKIPLKDLLYSEDKNIKLSFIKNRMAVDDYFDRLYYSVVIQSTLGFGDIFPATKSMRLVSMIQAISTILIIVI